MATENVGSIVYDSHISTDQLKRDAKEVQTISESTSKNLSSHMEESESRASSAINSIIGKVKVATVATVAAISAAGVATATFGIKSAADFEQTRIGLENMLGSADKARSLLTDISKFAAETPFEFPELAQATRQLIAFGFSADDAFSTMKQLGDVSAAVGAPINDLAYLMGTLRTQGRAFTIDIRQFAQRGIPIYEYLAKVLGKNEKAISAMIEAGQIGFPEVQKAFIAMTSQGGKFNGTMAKQSKSLSGIFSTLKDNIGQTVREMVGISVAGDIKPDTLMDFLIKGGTKATEVLPKLISNIGISINMLRGSFNDPSVTGSGFFGFLETVGSTARQVFDYLQPKLVALWNTIKESMPTYKEFGERVLLPLAGTFGKALVVGIGLSLVALNVFASVMRVVLGIGTTMFTFWTVTLPNGMATAWDFIVSKALWVKDNFWEIIGNIIGFFASLPIRIPILVAMAVAAIISTIVSVRWSDVFSGIWQGMQSVWDKITDIVVHAWQYIHDIKWSDLFVGIGKSIANAIMGVIEGAINGAISAIPGAPKVKIPRFASGTNYAPGGLAVVGERGPEVINLARGSQVIPNHELGDLGNSSSSNINITLNMQGIMARSKSDEREIAKSLLQRINEELKAKNQPLLGGGAI